MNDRMTMHTSTPAHLRPEKRHNAAFLAFDCSTGNGSVALSIGTATQHVTLERGRQSAMLIPTIDQLMRDAGIHYRDLTAILTTRGPGSFTSLRVALAAAHGLALVSGVRLRTLTTPEAYAWQAGKNCDVVLNAGKGEMFHQAFIWKGDRPVAATQIQLLTPDALPLTHPLIVGNVALAGVASTPQMLDAATLCRIAPALADTAMADAMPLYIRPPDATLPVQREAGTSSDAPIVNGVLP
jgi:tRNA threonylcarbamoyladenosine biosynthesis protein TsaB